MPPPHNASSFKKVLFRASKRLLPFQIDFNYTSTWLAQRERKRERERERERERGEGERE